MALRPKLSNNKKRKISMLLAQAFSALQDGNHKQCEQRCADIEAIQPGNADAAYLRGVVARDRDACDLAEDYFKQAIAAAPKRADFVAALAGLYLSTGNNKQAEPVYRQALAIDPHAIHAQVGLAGALVCLHRYDEAIEYLEAAKKQRPSAIDVRMGLFQACHDSGRIEAAHRHLQDILKRDPENAQAYYNIGLLELENGDLQAGEQSIRQAITCNADFPEAYTVLADLHRFDNENDDMLAMQQLYERCPHGSVERMHMSFALAKAHDDLGRSDMQDSHFDKAFALMQEGNAIRHSFSRYDEPSELGRYFRMYERLMEHWKQVLPKNMLIELSYEQLVAEPEQQSRVLLEACGLPWHPACLDFRHTSHRVLTASMTQVRQPIYTRSVGNAAPYQKHLQALLHELP